MSKQTSETAPSLLESKLTSDVINLAFESLAPRDLGAACRVCHRWGEVLSQPAAWHAAALRTGFVWDADREAAEQRAASLGGWKRLLSRECRLQRLWRDPANLHVRSFRGHSHWVPSILLYPKTRQLVTCSYDGTVRFWDGADAAVPRCFKMLTVGPTAHNGPNPLPHVVEGFSSIALDLSGEVPMLAAGSERGNVHVWEVWRPEDSEDARVAAAAMATHERAEPMLVPDGGHEPEATSSEGEGEGEGDEGHVDFPQARQRPHFARKIESWGGSHDFVQSILMLPGSRVVSGGDNGYVNIHRVGQRSSQQRLEGHTGAVMCLDATSDGTELISGSVDHSVRVWDVESGRCRARVAGHSRSVHCLTLGKAQPHGPPVLFTGSRDHTIKLWDLRSSECLYTLRGHTGSVTCIGAHGWKLLSGGGYNRGADDDEVLSVDATLRCWDLRRLGGKEETPCLWERPAPSRQEPPQPHSPFHLTVPHGDPVLSLQLMEDKVLTSHGGKNRTARIWDLAAIEPLH